MDGKMLARVGAVVFVAVAVTATAIEMTRKEEPPELWPSGRATQSQSDPLRDELIRCQALGEAGMRRILDELSLDAATDGDAEDHLVILRHTLMNPWLIDDRNGISYIDMYFQYLEQRIGALLPHD